MRLCVVIYVYIFVPVDVPWFSCVLCCWVGLLREAAVFLFVVATFSRLSAPICSLRLYTQDTSHDYQDLNPSRSTLSCKVL